MGAMRRAAPLLAALLLLAAPRAAAGMRVAFVPLSSESHVAAFTALSTEVERLGGHEVYMVRSAQKSLVLKNNGSWFY
jgi:hypothetical protein